MESKDKGKERLSGTGVLSLKAKVGYGACDFAANLVYQTVALYLIFFLTDVRLMDAALAGSFFFASKLWDAVTDPVMGYLADRTKSRWGRYRPYLLFGSFPLGFSFFLLFFTPKLTEMGMNLYTLFTFLAFSTAYTVINIPYSALTATLTMDTDERSSISGIRMAFAITGTLLTAGATKPLVALFPTELQGFQVLAGIYAVICAGVSLITFFSVRETVVQPKPKGFSILHDLRLVAENGPFIILTVTTILQMAAINLIASMINYYFKYNLRAETMVSVGFLCFFVSAIASLPLWVKVSVRFGKKKAFIAGMLLLGGVLLALFFASEAPMAVILALFALGGVGMSTQYLCPWAMVADTVEFGQWKTGERREGILYGFFSFAFKFAAAMSGMLAGLGLTASGYAPNVAQGRGTLLGINLLMTLVPFVMIILGLAAIMFYPIDAASHRSMVAELEDRER